MKAAPSRTILFLDDGATSPTSVEVSEYLSQAVACAVSVSSPDERFPVNFTSLFIGLLAIRDATGTWLEGQIANSRTNLKALLERRRVTIDNLRQLTRDPTPRVIFATPLLRSSSASSAITEAQRLAHDLHTIVDTRHVMAAYLSLPSYHDADFREFKIDRHRWAIDFAEHMARSYAAEAPFWATFVDHVFRVMPDLDLDDQHLEGHVARALRAASALAGPNPVTSDDVITAVLALAPDSRSAAFTRFAELVPSPSPPPVRYADEHLQAERLDQELRRHLAFAQRPAPNTTERRRLWGRDLITAALLSRDAPRAESLRSASQPVDIVRDRWFGFVTSDNQARSRQEWESWWAMAGVPLPGLRRAGYATETDEGDDKLGVKSEARAFARLILDRDVQPPLSIGLLGDWGSGKSFFIEQIKKQIKELKQEERPELYNHVVEIEFNAWHASDANLWASLVTTIFDEIWEKVSVVDNVDPEIARRRLVEQIEQARGAVHEAEGQVELARTALATAEEELDRRRKELAWDRHVRNFSKAQLKALARRAGWHHEIETINDVEAAIKALAASTNRLRLVLTGVMERPIACIGAPAAIIAFLALVAWLQLDTYAATEWGKEVSKWTAGALAAVGSIVTPLKLATSNVTKLTDKLDAIRSDYDRAVEEAKKSSPQEARKLSDARREFESAEASVKAAKARLAELLNQQATLDPRRRLGAFLQERVQSTVYRSQQGIISLVHKDFTQLSKFMKDLRDHPSEAASGGTLIKPFERIVLYVDDLDRCRPDHVVHMLEAVHLLLALDLFVVVVAVDSRWLTRALEVHYDELLVSDDDPVNEGLRLSTPQNYLEKIFQITYALGPMDPKEFKNYVSFLAGGDEQKTAAAVSAAATETNRENRQQGSASTAASQTTESSPQSDRQQQKTKSEDEKGPGDTLPPPSAVRLDEDEQQFICKLVPLLPTPRIAKRLINVYRLIKATKTADELEQFQRAKRPASCLLMLAILFGRPAVAAHMFRAIHEKQEPFEKPDELLIAAIKRRTLETGEPKPLQHAWQTLAQTLESLGITSTVGDCAREPIDVARYSLVSGHDWHTWTRNS
jgi:hypothetical protein